MRFDGIGERNFLSPRRQFPCFRDLSQFNALFRRINSLFRPRREFLAKLLESSCFWGAPSPSATRPSRPSATCSKGGGCPRAARPKGGGGGRRAPPSRRR